MGFAGHIDPMLAEFKCLQGIFDSLDEAFMTGFHFGVLRKIGEHPPEVAVTALYLPDHPVVFPGDFEQLGLV